MGNESHFVSVPPDRDPQPIREFGSWTRALEEMARWLQGGGIRRVVLPSTGVYGIAVHDVLQRQGREVNLGDARARRARKSGKPIGNQPAFDLAAELERIPGVNATTIDGIDAMTIPTLLAEVGPDLTAWKTERHWTSWLHLAPQRDVSGGKGIRHV